MSLRCYIYIPMLRVLSAMHSQLAPVVMAITYLSTSLCTPVLGQPVPAVNLSTGNKLLARKMRIYSSGISLQGNQTQELTGNVIVRGPVVLSGSAHLQLRDAHLVLQGNQDKDAHIRLSGSARLSMVGNSSIRLERTDSDVTLSITGTARAVIEKGTTEIIGVIKLAGRSIFRITDATLIRNFYKTSPPGGAGDTQLIDQAQLVIERGIVSTPTRHVGGQENHDVVSRGTALVAMTEASYFGGYLYTLENASLIWRNKNSRGEINGGLHIGDQAQVEVVHVNIGDIGLFLNEGDWGTFRPVTGGHARYEPAGKFNARLNDVNVKTGLLFHVSPGVKARFEGFDIEEQSLGISLQIDRFHANLGILPVGLRGKERDEVIESLRKVNMDITLRRSNVAWNIYLSGDADISVVCPENAGSPGAWEIEAYDHSTLRFLPGSVLAGNFLSAEDHGRVLVYNSIIKRLDESSVGHVRVVGKNALIRFERSRLEGTKIVAVDGKVQVINSPTPGSIDASGTATVDLVDSGTLPEQKIKVTDAACVTIRALGKQKTYGTCQDFGR